MALDIIKVLLYATGSVNSCSATFSDNERFNTRAVCGAHEAGILGRRITESFPQSTLSGGKLKVQSSKLKSDKNNFLSFSQD
jgi:hypothetical protein